MSHFLIEQMSNYADRPAVAQGDALADYQELLSRKDRFASQLREAGAREGTVLSLEAEYGIDSVAAFLAGLELGAILVPLSPVVEAQIDDFVAIAEVELRLKLTDGCPGLGSTGRKATHSYHQTLHQRNHPGLVLFTSGSTGGPKAVVHDLSLLLEKFRVRRQTLRTLVFLQLDHIGGINTLLYTLSNGGMIVVATSRSPRDVCAAIARHQVELLPTSPTFLNLLLLSGELENHDLSSLKLVTYGTEPMPASTLKRATEVLPHVRFQQTYGSTELGILRSKSREDQSLWVKIGGEGYDIQIRDGRLWVKADSAMLGYLNAANPIDADGYYDTQDEVEVDGEWVRFLGRSGEVINVGGNKVAPAHVESVLLELPNVLDAAVHGEPHPLVGQVVAATIYIEPRPDLPAFKLMMRQFCSGRLPSYAIPMKITLTDQPLHSERFKRMRRRAEAVE